MLWNRLKPFLLRQNQWSTTHWLGQAFWQKHHLSRKNTTFWSKKTKKVSYKHWGFCWHESCCTLQAWVVIINGFNSTAEVKLHVLLDQPVVKGTEMATLVIHTAKHKKTVWRQRRMQGLMNLQLIHNGTMKTHQLLKRRICTIFKVLATFTELKNIILK